MAFLRINNCLLDPSKISAVYQDEKDMNKITVIFDNGEKLIFIGQEAADLWKELDNTAGDWRGDQ